MKNYTKIIVILVAVLLVASIVLLATGNVSGKVMRGGCDVRVEIGSTYDTAVAQSAVDAAGFIGAVLLEGERTFVNVETSAMTDTALEKAAAALVAKLQESYPAASLVYADSFGPASGSSYTAGSVKALIAFVVLAFAYGWIRFGWRAGLAAVCTALSATVITGGVCVLLSPVFSASPALLGILAGVLCLTYLYAIVVYGKRRENPEYTVTNADLVAPGLALLACVLVFVSGGVGVLKLMFAGLFGCVVSILGMRCFAPSFFGSFAKSAK